MPSSKKPAFFWSVQGEIGTRLLAPCVTILALLVTSPVVFAQEAAAPGTTESTAAVPRGDGSGPKLRCDEPTHTFTERVWAGDIVTHEYVFANDGNEPLEILQVTKTCGCQAVEFDKVIAPGKEGKVTLKLTTPRAKSHVKKSLTVTTNDPARPTLQITIEGDVVPRIDIEPQAGANFGSIPLNAEQEELERVVKITNHTDKPMKLELVPLPDAQKNIFQTEIKEIEAGKEVEIIVKAKPPFDAGNNYTRYQFMTGIEEHPQVIVSARLYVPPLLQVAPSSLPVAVPLNRVYRRSATIRYNGEGTMKITGQSCDMDKVELTVSETQPGKSFKVDVAIPNGFDPGKVETAMITLTTDIKGHDEIKIPIRFTQTPTPAPAGISDPLQLIGKPLPAGKMVSVQGPAIDVGGDANQATVVFFWSTWSERSHALAPVLQRLANVYARKGARFVYINQDALTPQTTIADTCRKLGLPAALVAMDPRQVYGQECGVKELPIVLVAGRDGTVEAVHKGSRTTPDDLAGIKDALEVELDALLEGKNRQAFPARPGASGQWDVMDIMTQDVGQDMAAPRVAVESLRQYTGKHKPGEEVSYEVRFRNDGMRALVVSDITGSEGVTVQEGWAKEVRPNASAGATCKFKAPEQPGLSVHQVTITSNDPSRPNVMVALVGDVLPLLEINPPTGVDFGRNPRIYTMSRMATVQYNGSERIEYVSAKSDNEKFEATVERIGETPHAKVIVSTRTPFEIGKHTAAITIETTCRDQPTIELPVVLDQPPDIELIPAVVNVPPGGKLHRETVTINNNTMDSLNILGIDPSNRQIRTQFYPEPDGFSYRMEVTFLSNFECAPGGEKITLRTDHDKYSEIVIPIRMATR